MRAQTSLPAVGVALVVLVTTTLFAVTVADEQLEASRGTALERESAMGLADSLVAADASVTRRANVLAGGALESLDPGTLEAVHGLEPTAGVELRLDGRPILSRGAPADGSTIERIVLIERRSARAIVPRFNTTRAVTLPRRTPNATVRLSPSGNTTVTRILVDERVLRRDPGGLEGVHIVPTSRFETPTLRFQGPGSLSRGDVRVTYYPARTRKATLSVTVRRWGEPDG